MSTDSHSPRSGAPRLLSGLVTFLVMALALTPVVHLHDEARDFAHAATVADEGEGRTSSHSIPGSPDALDCLVCELAGSEPPQLHLPIVSASPERTPALSRLPEAPHTSPIAGPLPPRGPPLG